jgi:hypothetical protein
MIMRASITTLCLAFIIFFIIIGISTYGEAFPNLQFPADPRSYGNATAATLQAMTNQYSTLTSNHFAFVYNDSGAPIVYSYYFQLCAQFQSCTIKNFTVTLMPHQGININYMLELQAIWTTPGLYSIIATTGITGPNTNVLVKGFSNANIIPPYLQNIIPRQPNER